MKTAIAVLLGTLLLSGCSFLREVYDNPALAYGISRTAQGLVYTNPSAGMGCRTADAGGGYIITRCD
jgi:hypothetical protein